MRYTIAILFILSAVFTAAGQCYPDRHSTNWFDGWVSCTPSQNPNPERGMSHWILYDFDGVYQFGQTHFWNTNDPAHLDRGMREIYVDVSRDGVVWESAGEYTLEQADGRSVYEGADGPDLQGAEGRFLLITAKTNYGGACYGLSELRIEAEEVITSATEDIANACFRLIVAPNPFVDQAEVRMQSECGEPVNYVLVDALGREVRSGTLAGQVGDTRIPLRLAELVAGTYHLRVQQGSLADHRTLVKIDRP